MSGPPTEVEAASATYSGIYDAPVPLRDGVYEGEPFAAGQASRPQVSLVKDMQLTGDLDGDGTDEALFLLTESSGGSGSFTYLAVLSRGKSGVKNVGTADLGDRVQIRGWRIDDGVILVRLVESGPQDAACCPSRLVTRRWTLDESGLREAGIDDEGTLGPEVLAGVDWRLSGFGSGASAPAEPRATLEVRGREVSGTGGCNRYMGTLSFGETPGEIRLGPLAGTMMACPGEAMEFEQRFLAALAAVSRFSFHFGRLALASVAEDGTVTVLLFRAGPVEDGS